MKRIIVPILIVAAAGGIAAALIMNRPNPVVKAPEERVTLVETQVAKAQDMTFSVSSQGTVEPRTQTTLVAEVSGRVLEVSDKFVVGGFFREGDLLLSLDAADYEVSVQQARANLLTAQAQLTQEQAQADQAARQWDSSGRARADAPPLALRTPFLAEANARVLFAEADLARAERQLERTKIRAPYDGLVREKMVDIGQYVGTGTQLARTFAVDFAEVRLPLTDRDIAFLNLPRPGILASNSASMTGNSWGNANRSESNAGTPVVLRTTVGGQPLQWDARIVRTDGVIDSSTRVYYAVAQVRDPYGLRESSSKPALSIGSFVNATLQGITAHGVFTLPHSAVRSSNQVMIMDQEQRLRIRTVNVLRTDTENVYVDSGLNDGEQVIVSPVPVPIEGMRVSTAEGFSMTAESTR
jgi:RND family efflux transporter MFP subunit